MRASCNLMNRNKGSFIQYVRTKGEGGSSKSVHHAYKVGGGLARGSTYAKMSHFLHVFVTFSYAGSFYHTVLPLA